MIRCNHHSRLNSKAMFIMVLTAILMFTLSACGGAPEKSADAAAEATVQEAAAQEAAAQEAAATVAESTKAAETPAAGEPVLKVFDVEEGYMPYYFGKSDPTQTGLYIDIIIEIAKRANIKYELAYYPIGRMTDSFSKGESNVEVACNPAWRAKDKDISIYTKPVDTVRNVIAFNKGTAVPVKTAEDLKGKKIGAVRGFMYPFLEEGFKSGIITRQDADSEADQLTMLQNKRVDAIITSESRYFYLTKDKPEFDFEISEPVGNQEGLCIRLHKDLSMYLDKMNKAIDDMTADGTLKSIFDKYK